MTVDDDTFLAEDGLVRDTYIEQLFSAFQSGKPGSEDHKYFVDRCCVIFGNVVPNVGELAERALHDVDKAIELAVSLGDLNVWSAEADEVGSPGDAVHDERGTYGKAYGASITLPGARQDIEQCYVVAEDVHRVLVLAIVELMRYVSVCVLNIRVLSATSDLVH